MLQHEAWSISVHVHKLSMQVLCFALYCFSFVNGCCSCRRVVEGSRVLQKLAGLETNNERPLKRCQISNCGRLTPLTS